jgi:hypothetical protein
LALVGRVQSCELFRVFQEVFGEPGGSSELGTKQLRSMFPDLEEDVQRGSGGV